MNDLVMIAQDDEDWLDFEPAARTKTDMKPVATVLLMKKLGIKSDKPKPARAMVWLRRELADWANANGPRFRLQFGGGAANRIRIIPDNERGKFEAADFKGAIRLLLGVVNIWPDEEHEPVEARAEITPSGLVLTLPADFAKPVIVSAVPRLAPPPPPEPAPVVKRAVQPSEIVAGNHELRAALGVTDSFPLEIGGESFTPAEAAILEALLKRAEVSRAGCLIATHDPMNGDDERSDKLADVWICKMRPKLLRLGVSIVTAGGCFRIDLPHKQKLRGLIAAKTSENQGERTGS